MIKYIQLDLEIVKQNLKALQSNLNHYGRYSKDYTELALKSIKRYHKDILFIKWRLKVQESESTIEDSLRNLREMREKAEKYQEVHSVKTIDIQK